jgi:hypothetical protein
MRYFKTAGSSGGSVKFLLIIENLDSIYVCKQVGLGSPHMGLVKNETPNSFFFFFVNRPQIVWVSKLLAIKPYGRDFHPIRECGCDRENVGERERPVLSHRQLEGNVECGLLDKVDKLRNIIVGAVVVPKPETDKVYR